MVIFIFLVFFISERLESTLNHEHRHQNHIHDIVVDTTCSHRRRGPRTRPRSSPPPCRSQKRCYAVPAVLFQSHLVIFQRLVCTGVGTHIERTGGSACHFSPQWHVPCVAGDVFRALHARSTALSAVIAAPHLIWPHPTAPFSWFHRSNCVVPHCMFRHPTHHQCLHTRSRHMHVLSACWPPPG